MGVLSITAIFAGLFALKTAILDTEYDIVHDIPLDVDGWIDTSSTQYQNHLNSIIATAYDLSDTPGLRALVTVLGWLKDSIGETLYEWSASEYIRTPQGLGFLVIDSQGQFVMGDFIYNTMKVYLSPIQCVKGKTSVIIIRNKTVGGSVPINGSENNFFYDSGSGSYKLGTQFNPTRYYTWDDLSRDAEILLLISWIASLLIAKKDTLGEFFKKAFGTIKEIKWWSWKRYMKAGMTSLLRAQGMDLSSLPDIEYDDSIIEGLTPTNITTLISDIKANLANLSSENGLFNEINDAINDVLANSVSGLEKLENLLERPDLSQEILNKLTSLYNVIGLKLTFL